MLITIVSDPPALEEVLWGAKGALEGLRRGSALIDSSTVSPELARRAAAACAEQGVDFLDAPVTGGTWGAKKGELVFMIGGKAEVAGTRRSRCWKVGKEFFLLGPNGAGQTVKLAMNLLLALEVEALAEALALVTSGGVAGEKLGGSDAIKHGARGGSRCKGAVMLKNEFPPSFPLRLMHKDMRPGARTRQQTGSQVAGRGCRLCNVRRGEGGGQGRCGLCRGGAILEKIGSRVTTGRIGREKGERKVARRAQPGRRRKNPGMVFTTTAAVAMSPCVPPGIVSVRLRRAFERDGVRGVVRASIHLKFHEDFFLAAANVPARFDELPPPRPAPPP